MLKKPDRSQLTALVDADTFLYLAAHGTERSIDWGDGYWTTSGSLPEAIDLWENYLGRFVGFQRVIPFLSQDREDYWRMKAWPLYKANRTQGRVPFMMPILKAHLLDVLATEYGGVVIPGEEADDLVGTAAASDPHTVVFSMDKDLKQVPGTHGNFQEPDHKLETVTREEAWEHWLTQALVGDTADNYPGIKGVGPAGAAKLLTEPRIQTVLDIFSKKKQTKEHAHAMLSVARIRQHPDEITEDGWLDYEFMLEQEASIFDD